MDNNQTLKQYFNADNKYFDNILIDCLDLSVRPSRCLKENNVKTIGQLLDCSVKYLYTIKTMGATSIEEIKEKLKDFLNNYAPADDAYDNNARGKPKAGSYEKIRGHIEELILNLNYSPDDLNEEETELFDNLRQSRRQLGPELSLDVYTTPEKFIPISLALNDLGSEYGEFIDFRSEIENALSKISEEVKEKPVGPFLNAYKTDRKIELPFDEFKDYTELKIKNLPNLIDFAQYNSDNKKELATSTLNFLNWLNFDLNANISKLKQIFKSDGTYKRERELQILKMRAGGMTLEQIGARQNVTRERIRQIESKIIKRVENEYLGIKPDLVLIICAMEGGSSVIPVKTYQRYLGDCSDAFFYVMQFQKKSLSPHYFYSPDLNAVIIKSAIGHDTRNSNVNLEDKIYEFTESLPSMLTINDLEKLIGEFCRRYNIEYDYINYRVYQIYKKYGTMASRGKPTNTAMVDYVVKHYFKDGFKTDDDACKSKLNYHIERIFGVDLSLANGRAVDAIVQKIGILAGRSTYIHPDNLNLDKEKLNAVNTINKYIGDSNRTLYSFNELYQKFSYLFEGTAITNANALHGLIKYYGTPFYIFRDYITKDRSWNFIDEVEHFARENGTFTKQNILDYFKGAAESQILQVIDKSEIIFNSENGIFVCADTVFNIKSEDVSAIYKYLKSRVSAGSPLHISSAYEELRTVIPDFLKRNSIYNSGTLFAALQYMFKDEFKFSRPYIAVDEGIRTTYKSVLLNHLAGTDRMSLSDLKELCGRHNINYQSLASFTANLAPEYLRADHNGIISADAAGINKYVIADIADTVKNELYYNDYIVLSKIDDFSQFPVLNVDYTDYLLESILNAADIKIVYRNCRIPNVCRGVALSDRYAEAKGFDDFIIKYIRDLISKGKFTSKPQIILWLRTEGFSNEKTPYFLENGEYFYFDENGDIHSH